MSVRTFLARHRYKVVPAVVTLAAAIAAVVFWEPLAAWFSGEPMGTAPSAAVQAEAGPFELQASIAPNPPRQTDNTLLLEIEDAQGNPVEDARVTVTYFMPAMGSMPEMRGEAEVTEKGSGSYAAEFDLPMGGSWTLIARVEEQGRSAEARFGMTVGNEGLTLQSQGASGATPESAEEVSRGPVIEPIEARALPPKVLAKLQAAFAAYEEIRNLLAADTLNGVDPHARALSATLNEASEDADGSAARALAGAAEAAEGLANEDDLATARRVFGSLSKYLVALAAADPRLQEGRFVFECPMAEGFNKWIQTTPELENPYMGKQMLTCGSRSEFRIEAPEQAQANGSNGDEVAYYTCSMHPSVKQEQPGTCPICGMDLTPVTKQELETGTILVDEERRRRIGVKLAPVQRESLVVPIRAVGEVAYDETKLHDVTLRMGGWVQELRADATGERVRRGQVLFTLYSPELLAAQLEYLNALRVGQGATGVSPTLRATSESLERSARQRLRLLGMPDAQIKQLAQRGKPWENVPVLSPATGYITQKNVIEGARVAAGELVYRIADLDRVWIEAQVYESDLPHVRVGQQVEVTLPYVPGRTYEGEVDHVYPYLDDRTRTGKVRVVLPNPQLELRPEMYANVEFQANRGQRLVVPESAVIYTGPRRIVFVDLGGGRLEPRVVELGARSGDYYEVLSGLEAGDVVVTSGNFLIASESRLKSAGGLWDGASNDAAE